MRANAIGTISKGAAALLVVALASSAAAKTDAKDSNAGPHVRYAHSYAEAMAEAKERGCVVFATFHEDG